MPKFISRFNASLSGSERLMAAAGSLIFVILIIAQVAALQARHRDQERKQDISFLQQQIDKFYAVSGRYPMDLIEIRGLPRSACQAPNGSGSCAQPDYIYKAFQAGTPVTKSSATNCNNRRPAKVCVNYLLYAERLETTGGEYLVQSY